MHKKSKIKVKEKKLEESKHKEVHTRYLSSLELTKGLSAKERKTEKV